MTATVALDRDALYYPYIHITDVSWLKSTLLCFPGMRRMVPGSYVPTDLDEVKTFCDLKGPRNEPLLRPVDLFSQAAKTAEEDLLAKLKEHDSTIRKKYSRAVATRKYRRGNLLLLHDEKITVPLYSYLTAGKGQDVLAWRVSRPSDRPDRGVGSWLAMHPVLGSAILSVKATALADAFGLDIVTDSTNVHDIVASHSAADVFDALLNGRTAPQAPTTQDSVDDLAQIVMTTAFDVSRLTPQQIADLVADGHDLRRFKNALVPIVASLPQMTDHGERQRRLESAANEVLAEWSRYKKALPRFALDAIVEVTDLKWPEFVAAGLLVPPRTWWVGAGLGIALLTHKGAKVFRKYREETNSPYRYLSNIQRVSKRTQSSLSIAPPR